MAKQLTIASSRTTPLKPADVATLASQFSLAPRRTAGPGRWDTAFVASQLKLATDQADRLKGIPAAALATQMAPIVATPRLARHIDVNGLAGQLKLATERAELLKGVDAAALTAQMNAVTSSAEMLKGLRIPDLAASVRQVTGRPDLPPGMDLQAMAVQLRQAAELAEWLAAYDIRPAMSRSGLVFAQPAPLARRAPVFPGPAAHVGDLNRPERRRLVGDVVYATTWLAILPAAVGIILGGGPIASFLSIATTMTGASGHSLASRARDFSLRVFDEWYPAK